MKDQPITFVTIDRDLKAMRAQMATKDDIAKLESNMATKDDIAKLESNMATKDDIKELSEKMVTGVVSLLQDHIDYVDQTFKMIQYEIKGVRNDLKGKVSKDIYKDDQEELRRRVMKLEKTGLPER